MATHGIFCLEGEWEDNLADKLSVRPGLDMLTTMRRTRLVHRNAVTRGEFEYFFSKWATRRYDAFPLAYLAYHGRPGLLDLAGEPLTLTDIAELAPGRLGGRVVYFGSCGTLAASDDELQEFVRTTGAHAIAGYTKSVDWAESAAFDFTLLPELLDSVDIRKLHTRLCKRHPHFVDGLGLRLATASWVSPRTC
ncbi:DUF6642 family protein [Geodermatophilus sp. SYSU D00708]